MFIYSPDTGERVCTFQIHSSAERAALLKGKALSLRKIWTTQHELFYKKKKKYIKSQKDAAASLAQHFKSRLCGVHIKNKRSASIYQVFEVTG